MLSDIPRLKNILPRPARHEVAYRLEHAVKAGPNLFTPVELHKLLEDAHKALTTSQPISIQLLEKEIVRLKDRENDLLEANNRYLKRARDAEDALKEHREAYAAQG